MCNCFCFCLHSQAENKHKCAQKHLDLCQSTTEYLGNDNQNCSIERPNVNLGQSKRRQDSDEKVSMLKTLHWLCVELRYNSKPTTEYKPTIASTTVSCATTKTNKHKPSLYTTSWSKFSSSQKKCSKRSTSRPTATHGAQEVGVLVFVLLLLLVAPGRARRASV